MPKNTDSLNRSLFELLNSKGYDPTLLSTAGKETPTPEEAEVFQFNFVKDGEDYGKVTMSIDGLHKLVIYYDDDIANSEKEENESGDLSWYQLLNQLKKFAQKYQLSFELRNVSNLKHDMAKREYMKKKESIAEGYYPMGKKASYSDAVPSVKIVLQHTRQIEEGEQRYRNIARIFLENEQGERFLAPTTKPGIARVYARHIAEGGQPHDERWNHINSLCEEYQKMAGFVRAVRNGQFNESAQQLVNEGVNHYQSLRESLSKLTGHRGYNAYFESWTPPLMEDDTDTSNINELFVQETVDPRIESVMPILSKLQKKISEMSEVNQLAEWADNLTEGGDGGEASEEPVEQIEEEESLTSKNPGGIPEGHLSNPGVEDSPVVNSITRRIINQRTDLLAKHGPEKVAQAIDSVAHFVGDVDEIGSSDISGWVKQVEDELNSVTESIVDDYEDMSDSELMRHARMLGLEDNIVMDGEGGLANRMEMIYLLQQEAGDNLEESGLQAYLGNKKYGKEGMDALRKAGREHASKEKMAKIRAKYDKLDEEDVEEGLGDVAKKVGSALKKGATAVGKAIVGPDDDELLRDLKKRAGVRNPQTGKPSMAHSDVEKREEGVAEGGYQDDSKEREENLRYARTRNPVADVIRKKLNPNQKPEKEQGVAEDLDANQKRVGQLGPYEKVKNNNIGKLVGANENFINTDDQAVVTETNPKGKVDFAAKFKKNIDKVNQNKKSTDEKIKQHHDDQNKQVKEGQEDLDAILRIIRK
jgi:flagellar hook-basal body complex protein FliE